MNKLFKVVHLGVLLYTIFPSNGEKFKMHRKFILALC